VISVTVYAFLRFERAFIIDLADAATVSADSRVSAMFCCVSKLETIFTLHCIAYIVSQCIREKFVPNGDRRSYVGAG